MVQFAALTVLVAGVSGFVHPGLLHTKEDFARVKSFVDAKKEPWLTSWNLLTKNPHAAATWKNRATETVYRGSDGVHSQNYPQLYNDAHAAYQLALRWKIGGDKSFADASIRILDAWSSTMKAIGGNSDGFLAAGLYGYQLANAGEIMRDYTGWPAANRTRLGTLLQDVFYKDSERFLRTHNDASRFHYWANWDLCNIAAIQAIGVFTDNQTMFDYATNYFIAGDGMGAMPNFITANHTEAGSGKILAQSQEAGRDQGHATLDLALLGIILQQGYNQGKDLFALMSNSGLAASEFIAKYNVGQDVPWTTYVNPRQGTFPGISPASRGNVRPGFELLYAHYNDVKGLNASWTKAYVDYSNANNAANNGVEGGGGNYESTSGGYDYLGFGTLMYRQKA